MFIEKTQRATTKNRKQTMEKIRTSRLSLTKNICQMHFFVFPIVTLLNLSFDAKLIGNEITSTKTAHLKALQMNELYECTAHTKKHLAKIKTEN